VFIITDLSSNVLTDLSASVAKMVLDEVVFHLKLSFELNRL